MVERKLLLVEQIHFVEFHLIFNIFNTIFLKTVREKNLNNFYLEDLFKKKYRIIHNYVYIILLLTLTTLKF